jgi:hypothetical protein
VILHSGPTSPVSQSRLSLDLQAVSVLHLEPLAVAALLAGRPCAYGAGSVGLQGKHSNIRKHSSPLLM